MQRKNNPLDRPGYQLNELGELLYNSFTNAYGDDGCRCWTGCAPCGWCTHEGNPHNLAEDEEVWMKDGFDSKLMELEALVRLERELEVSVKIHKIAVSTGFGYARINTEARMRKMYAEFGKVY